MKKIILLTAALATSLAAHATLYTTNWSTGFANGGIVPDNNFSGWSDSRTISGLTGGSVAGLAVELQLSGGWNGDLYAFLVHDSGFTVLLDHVGVGVSGVSAYGYGDAGMDVTLGATGTSIHQYGGNNTFSGAPTGTFQTDNTSGSLSSFVGTNPNGTWSLFIADTSGGGVTTVENWGLHVDIVAVPEVETWVAAALAGAFGAFWLNRQFFGKAGPRRNG